MDELTNYEAAALAFAHALSIPAIHPDFKNLPLITGTAGEMEMTEEAEKWFYKIPYNEDDEWEYIPCTCSCHSNKNIIHMTACCQNGYKKVRKIKPKEDE